MRLVLQVFRLRCLWDIQVAMQNGIHGVDHRGEVCRGVSWSHHLGELITALDA